MRLRRILIAAIFLMAMRIVQPQGTCRNVQQYDINKLLVTKDAATFYEVFDAEQYCWTSSYIENDDRFDMSFFSDKQIKYVVHFRYGVIQSIDCSYASVKIDCDNIDRDINKAKLLNAVHERTR